MQTFCSNNWSGEVRAKKIWIKAEVKEQHQGGMNAAAVSAQTLQPFDILIVQANANTLFSHFISLWL